MFQARAVQDQALQELTRRDGIRYQVQLLLENSLLEALRQFDTQKKRLETVKSMAGVGRETNLAVEQQEIVAERSRLAVLSNRLQLLVNRMQGQ